MLRRLLIRSSQTKTDKAFKIICVEFQLRMINGRCPLTLTSATFFKLKPKIKLDYEMSV